MTAQPVTTVSPASLLNIIRLEPALVTSLLAGAAALVSAYVVHVNHTQEAAITTIAVSLAALITAALARPARVPVMVGAVLAGVVAAGAFGLHLPVEVTATLATTLTMVLSLLFRGHLTPLPTSRS